MGEQTILEIGAGNEIVRRPGPPPKTQRRLPHIQLNQFPPSEMVHKLLDACTSLPHVRSQEPRIASRETLAIYLPDRCSQGPVEAFIDDHEFCHLHPPPNGGLHLTLPLSLRQIAMESGWAEEHPAVGGGVLPPTVVMVYAPRNAWELEIVLSLVEASHRFALGIL